MHPQRQPLPDLGSEHLHEDLVTQRVGVAVGRLPITGALRTHPQSGCERELLDAHTHLRHAKNDQANCKNGLANRLGVAMLVHL